MSSATFIKLEYKSATMEELQLFYDQIASLSKGELVAMKLLRAKKLTEIDAKAKDRYEILRLELEVDALNAAINGSHPQMQQ